MNKNTIEPTIEGVALKAPIKEADNTSKSLLDLQSKYSISDKLFLHLLDTMMSEVFTDIEINEIDEFIAAELRYETAKESIKTNEPEIIAENAGTSPDNLVDKLDGKVLKDLVKSSGIKLTGSESSQELKGMAKALAASNESFSRRACKTATILEATKLKRKKGIGKSTTPVVENVKRSKFLK